MVGPTCFTEIEECLYLGTEGVQYYTSHDEVYIKIKQYFHHHITDSNAPVVTGTP
jgi:hypothetical protein